MSYCHKVQFTPRYTELDFKDELKLSALLGFAQESASFSADELGFGYEALKSQGLGFIIVNSYAKIFRPIGLGELLTVETWPLPPKFVSCERDYRVRGADGEIAAAIASRWCLVDLKTFSLVSPERLGEVHQNCPYSSEKSVEVPSWKIKKLGGTGTFIRKIQVGISVYDHYQHVNNTRYADFFLDCFSQSELDRKIESFQISYVKQAKAGDELTFYRKDEGATSTLEAFCGDELISQFQITFEEKLS